MNHMQQCDTVVEVHRKDLYDSHTAWRGGEGKGGKGGERERMSPDNSHNTLCQPTGSFVACKGGVERL